MQYARHTAPTDRVRVRRLPERGRYDREAITPSSTQGSWPISGSSRTDSRS